MSTTHRNAMFISMADLVRMLLEHPATAGRLAFRLCELFIGEGAIDAAAIQELAQGLRQRILDIAWAIETVLRSQSRGEVHRWVPRWGERQMACEHSIPTPSHRAEPAARASAYDSR